MTHSSTFAVGGSLALLLAGSLAYATGAGDVAVPPAPARNRVADEPLVLFQKMMPVFMHPRCQNCHGGVDPVSGQNHKGKAVPPGVDCNNCHSDAPDDPKPGHWHLPNPNMNFVGKDALGVCAVIADFAMHAGRTNFLDHLKNDLLVVLGFAGLAGGARVPGQADPGDPPDPPADPPPMSQADFVAAGTTWYDDGMAACARDGEIVQKETVITEHTRRPRPDTEMKLEQRWDRSVTVTLNGPPRAHIVVKGQQVNTVTVYGKDAQGRPCTMTGKTTETVSGTTDGPAQVRTKVAPGGDYTIAVELPAERTQQRVEFDRGGDCAPVPAASPPTVHDSKWAPWTFYIEGYPKVPPVGRLAGGCSKTMYGLKSDPNDIFVCFRKGPANHRPWLLFHGASGSSPEGKDNPFHITTSWNITYRK